MCNDFSSHYQKVYCMLKQGMTLCFYLLCREIPNVKVQMLYFKSKYNRSFPTATLFLLVATFWHGTLRLHTMFQNTCQLKPIVECHIMFRKLWFFHHLTSNSNDKQSKISALYFLHLILPSV